MWLHADALHTFLVSSWVSRSAMIGSDACQRDTALQPLKTLRQLATARAGLCCFLWFWLFTGCGEMHYFKIKCMCGCFDALIGHATAAGPTFECCLQGRGEAKAIA